MTEQKLNEITNSVADIYRNFEFYDCIDCEHKDFENCIDCDKKEQYIDCLILLLHYTTNFTKR